jgi:PAS domain S-box-containing protein
MPLAAGRGRSLRAQLVVLVLVTLVPMLLFAAGVIVWSSRQQRAVVEQRAIEVARALLGAVERELAAATAALETLAKSRRLDAGDDAGFRDELRRALDAHPAWLTMTVSTPDGHQIVNMLRPRGEPLPPDPDPWSLREAVRTARPTVSGVVVDALSKQYSFGVRMPIAGSGGVKYVVTAVLTPATIADILSRQRLPSDWVGAVLDARHVHVARTRAPEEFVAQPVAPDLAAALEKSAEGWIEARTLDGQPVYAVFSRSGTTGWSVALGIPVETVDGPLHRSLGSLAAGGLAAALVAVVLAVVVGRRLAWPIAAVAESAPALVRGDEPPAVPGMVAEVEALVSAVQQAASERARAEDALQRTSRLLAAVFEGTTDGVYVKDAAGRYLMINEAGARLLGRTPREVVGMDDTALFMPASARRIMALDREVMTAGQPHTYENPDVETPDRVVRSYLSTKVPYRDAEGRVVGVMGITRDISERKRAEQERARALEREHAARREAETANRAKDEFLAVLSHELRTPLNAVYGWARMLRSARLAPDVTRRAVEAIERNARAQLQLIEDLLDISRIITGKMRLEIRPLELSVAVAAAVESTRPAADAKGIALETAVCDADLTITGDADRLQQVVWNLVSNAVKFTPAGGRVRVEVRAAGADGVELAVTDTGQGISPEVLPFVFERFRQGDSSTTRAHGGLGLGLALVRHLVELHGGTVSASSDGDGCGATFVVRLPRAVPAGRAGDASRVPGGMRDALGPDGAPSLQGTRVLVVDDDQDALDLTRTILESARADVRTCESAAAAVDVLRDWVPHVMLCDLAMPDEDGYGLLDSVHAIERARGVHVPAIALTAFGRLEDRARTLKAGFTMHLSKPADPTELVSAVARFRS